jgi:hypothetical protein
MEASEVREPAAIYYLGARRRSGFSRDAYSFVGFGASP